MQEWQRESCIKRSSHVLHVDGAEMGTSATTRSDKSHIYDSHSYDTENRVRNPQRETFMNSLLLVINYLVKIRKCGWNRGYNVSFPLNSFPCAVGIGSQDIIVSQVMRLQNSARKLRILRPLSALEGLFKQGHFPLRARGGL
jgi:hypothetical protein